MRVEACLSNKVMILLYQTLHMLVNKDVQGGSDMTGTNCDLFAHK